MRLFLGINLPEYLKNALSAELPRFGYLKFRQIPKENWHVTLKFIGEVGERELHYIQETLPPLVSRFKQFELVVKDVGFLNKRIFAFNLERSPKLFALFRLIDEKLGACGALRKERYRTFTPHITVGRKDVPVRRDLHASRHFDLKTRAPFQFSVSSVDLMESFLCDDGSVYKLLKEFSFVDIKNAVLYDT
jgi:2'-5' RNA ligase